MRVATIEDFAKDFFEKIPVSFNIISGDKTLLRKFRFNFSHGAKMFSVENPLSDEEDASFSNARFYTRLIDQNKKRALFLLEIRTYCRMAEKATRSEATKKTLELFMSEIDETEKTPVTDINLPEFMKTLFSQFCISDDPVLSQVQGHLSGLTPFFLSENQETDLETHLRSVDKIKNRVKHISLDAAKLLQKAKSSIRTQRTEDMLESARALVAAADLSDPKNLAQLVEDLRMQRRSDFTPGQKISNAYPRRHLMAAISTLVQPYLASSHLSSAQLDIFTLVFAQIPYSSKLWQTAFQSLSTNFNSLTITQKLSVLGTVVAREEKLNRADKNVIDLVLRMQMGLDESQKPELTRLIKKHNNPLNRNHPLRIVLEDLEPEAIKNPALKGRITAAVNVLKQKDLDFIESNREKAEKSHQKMMLDTAEALANYPKKRAIPETLEGRIQRLEALFRELPLADTENRNALQHLIEKGRITLQLEKRRNKIFAHEETRLFYNTHLRGLISFLMAARVIASGDVERRNQKTHIAAAAVCFLGDFVPVAGGLLKKAADAIEFAGKWEIGKNADITNELTTSNTGLELFAEKIALSLTEMMQEELQRYTLASVKEIADHCTARFKRLFIEHPESAENDKVNQVVARYVRRITEPQSTGILQKIYQSIYHFFARPLETKRRAPRGTPQSPQSIPDLLKHLHQKQAHEPKNTRTEENTVVPHVDKSENMKKTAEDKDAKGKEEMSSDPGTEIAELKKTVASLRESLAKTDQELAIVKAQNSSRENREETYSSSSETPIIGIIRDHDQRIKEHDQRIEEAEIENFMLRKDLMDLQLLTLREIKSTIERPRPELPPAYQTPPPASKAVFDDYKTPSQLQTLRKKAAEDPDNALEETRLVIRTLKGGMAACDLVLSAKEKHEGMAPIRLRSREDLSEIKRALNFNEPLAENLDEASKLLKELLITEDTFCKGLAHLCTVFYTAENTAFYKKELGEETYAAVVQRIELIHGIAINPFSELDPKSITPDNFPAHFKTFSEIFRGRLFITRITECIAVSHDLNALSSLLAQNEGKKRFTQSEIPGKTPSDFLITIVQRCPRYVLLLKAMQKSKVNNPSIDKTLRVAETYASIFNNLQSDTPAQGSKLSFDGRASFLSIWHTRKKVEKGVESAERENERGENRNVVKKLFE